MRVVWGGGKLLVSGCIWHYKRFLNRHNRNAQDPASLQLQKDGVVLEDAKKLADLRIDNDDVIAMCYKTEGGCETCDTLGALRYPAVLCGRLCRRASHASGACAQDSHCTHPDRQATTDTHTQTLADGAFEPVDITDFAEAAAGGGGGDEAMPMLR